MTQRCNKWAHDQAHSKVQCPLNYRTPLWHRCQLQDLITMVNAWDLSNFFLTLTTNEVLETWWQGIETIENIAKHYNADFTRKDYLVECVGLFHTRLQLLMRKHFLSMNLILGCITQRKKKNKVSRLAYRWELEHFDVWDPIDVSSLGGSHYYVTFIDDATRKTWVTCIQRNSNVFETFKKWKDWAWEYVSTHDGL